MNPDYLVPDPQVKREFGITAMTLWRWTRDQALEFPPLIKINNRNYRSRNALEAFKARLIAKALRS
jgi:predicted DNA-binding transcriptional regulator AlpA